MNILANFINDVIYGDDKTCYAKYTALWDGMPSIWFADSESKARTLKLTAVCEEILNKNWEVIP